MLIAKVRCTRLSRDDDNDPKRGQIDFAANKKKSIDTGTS